MVERRRKEVHRDTNTKEVGRKGWRRQWGRSGKMMGGIRDRGEQPHGQKKKKVRRAVDRALRSVEELSTVPKA